VRHDRTGNQPDRFEDDSFRVRHVSPVLQADEPARGLDSVDLRLCRFLHMRPGGQVGQDLREKIADRRMTTHDVLQREHRHVPGHSGLGIGLDVIDQAVHVILFRYDRLPAGQAVPDDVLLHELSDLVAPVRHPGHVLLVERHQEWDEVRGVALVHLVEHLVEVLDHAAERTVPEAKASRAEIFDEDVRAREHDEWLDVHIDARNQGQVVDQQFQLAANNAVQLVVSRGKGARESVRPQHLPSDLLDVRPVAECQSCTGEKEERFQKRRRFIKPFDFSSSVTSASFAPRDENS